METENEQAQDVYEQEETSVAVDNASEVANEDDYTPPTKAEYTKIKRQALAYQALKGAKESTQTKEAPRVNTEADRFRELELRLDGYTAEEIGQIKEFGFDKVNNPLVQKAIETMRKERKSKEADQSISNKSQVYQKYTNDDLKNMSVDDLRKILPHAE